MTKEEKQYFSYYMDNGEFTNGFAYRSLYTHGCIISEEDTEKHHIAYFIFLRLLTILILKTRQKPLLQGYYQPQNEIF